MKERFVHSLSHIVYDKVSTLWHIDRESEELMSRIASRVVLGIFCLEYLSHINSFVNKKAGMKKNITALDLSDEDLIATLKARISQSKETAGLFKNAARMLKKILELADIKTLEDLTKVAHTGDYLLSSLQDLRDLHQEEYAFWLSSIPYYYEKDLQHLGLTEKMVKLHVHTSLLDSDSHAPYFWNEQSPVELFYPEKIYSDHRINLNAHMVLDPSGENYFPCTSSLGKNKRRYSKARGYVCTSKKN